jgi:putative heme-binding domain-containing protein
MVTALAFVKSPGAVGHMIELANDKGFPMKDLAQWWLLNRKGNDWKEYGVDEAMKARGLYDPDKVTITPVDMPPPVKDAPALPSAGELAKLPGDKAKGQAAVAVCYTCHKVGGNGMDFGPDLTTFAKQQPVEVLVEAIARPSADISHGFEGSRVTLKDGTVVTGMVLSNSDPLIVKCMGGLVQTIPGARVAKVEPLGRSLMVDPANLGLNAQAIADIAAYLRSL